jgi:predicted AAA+ superfamily ATPase
MPPGRWEDLLPRVERVLDLAERLLAREAPAEANGTADVHAFRFRRGALEAIPAIAHFPPDALIGVERSVARLRANLAAFVRGRPALDALLYGERGTGKSSAVRGLLAELAPAGLRLVEVRRDDLAELPRVFALLRGRPERFALVCDDLSFSERDDSWKELKAALDGGVEARPANALILATSNRRHLLPERASENREARVTPDGELHPGETAEEKLSLSDRFGLLLPFFAFDQPTYLRIVDWHARDVGLAGRLATEELHARALRVALERSSRSGRTARQACIAILQELEAVA